MASITLTYLIPDLRLNLGDINPETERWTDAWLEIALLGSVATLQNWWDYKYLVDKTTQEVSRNPKRTYLFDFTEPPVIQTSDERPIIIMACIILVQGDLENSAFDLGSWKDHEVSYSNIEGGRTKRDVLARLWDELLNMIKPPQKVLAKATKSHMPGYKDHTYEE